MSEKHNLKIAAIIQARMGSTRLPGKVLMPLPTPQKSNQATKPETLQNSEIQQTTDQTILGRLISSLKMVQGIQDIWLATTELPKDDVLENQAKTWGVRLFRGSENDVLSRFWGILEQNDYDCVFRFTADNPCVDIHAVEFVLKQHNPKLYDYTRLNGMPIGMHVEIINAKTLLNLKYNSQLSAEDHEHVTIFIKRHSNFAKNMLQISDYLEYLNSKSNTETTIISPILSLENQNRLTQLRMTIDHEYEYKMVSDFYEFAEKKNGKRLLDLIIQWQDQCNPESKLSD